jgi:ribosomal protein S14
MKYKSILDKYKRNYFKMKEVKKTSLKIVIRLKNNLKLYGTIELSKLNQSSIIKNRCCITSRSKAIYKNIGISRIKLRYLSLNGIQVGFKKSNW